MCPEKTFCCDFVCVHVYVLEQFGFFNWIWQWVVEISSQTLLVMVWVPGALIVQLSGNTFLRFLHLDAIKREAAPSGEQTAFLFSAWLCFWAVQIFVLSEIRLLIRNPYGSSTRWIFASRTITWGFKGRKLSSELSLWIVEVKLSPKVDKLALSNKQ